MRSEYDLLNQVAEIIRSNIAVPCTACGYCFPNCPMHIAIPKIFALYNEYVRTPDDDWKMQNVYESLTKNRGKPSDCIRCKKCEQNCPQKIKITDFLPKITSAFA